MIADAAVKVLQTLASSLSVSNLHGASSENSQPSETHYPDLSGQSDAKQPPAWKIQPGDG